MGSATAQPTCRCDYRPFQLLRATKSQLAGKHILPAAQNQTLQRTCFRTRCTVAAAVPGAITPVPKTSLLFAAVEKLFNFPPVYAAAVKQVSSPHLTIFQKASRLSLFPCMMRVFCLCTSTSEHGQVQPLAPVEVT